MTLIAYRGVIVDLVATNEFNVSADVVFQVLNFLFSVDGHTSEPPEL